MLPTIGTDLEDIYLSGDQHFYHGNMIKFVHRPFLSLADQTELVKNGGRWHDGSWKGPREVKYKISDEGVSIMNNSLIDNINKTVPKKGKLITLGDWSIAPKSPEDYPRYVKRCTEMRERIDCENVYIIWGNHDVPELIQHLFQWSGFKARITLSKLLVGGKDPTILVVDHTANAVWDESHRGALHCYGHTHAEIEPYIEQVMPGRRSMDVGVDNAAKVLGEYRPFRLQEVVDLLKDKPGYGFNPNIPTQATGHREHA